MTRVGVVTTTRVEQAELPPGMLRFIQYVARPWGGNLENYSIQLTTVLNEGAEWVDRCTHIIIDQEPGELPMLRLDWNRTFKASREATPHTLKEAVEAASEASLAYFEDLAEGNRFDEELIRSAT